MDLPVEERLIFYLDADIFTGVAEGTEVNILEELFGMDNNVIQLVEANQSTYVAGNLNFFNHDSF